jgi:hypothetical protein
MSDHQQTQCSNIKTAVGLLLIFALERTNRQQHKLVTRRSDLIEMETRKSDIWKFLLRPESAASLGRRRM